MSALLKYRYYALKEQFCSQVVHLKYFGNDFFFFDYLFIELFHLVLFHVNDLCHFDYPTKVI